MKNEKYKGTITLSAKNGDRSFAKDICDTLESRLNPECQIFHGGTFLLHTSIDHTFELKDALSFQELLSTAMGVQKALGENVSLCFRIRNDQHSAGLPFDVKKIDGVPVVAVSLSDRSVCVSDRTEKNLDPPWSYAGRIEKFSEGLLRLNDDGKKVNYDRGCAVLTDEHFQPEHISKIFGAIKMAEEKLINQNETKDYPGKCELLIEYQS